MIDESLSAQINRGNRNVLIISGVALGVALVCIAIYGRYLRSLVVPFPIGATELDSNRKPNPYLDTFVTIHADKIIGTDFIQREQNSDRVVSEIVAIQFGDRFLVVNAAPGGTSQTYTGKLVAISPEVQSTVFTDSPGANPEINARHYPYLLDTLAERDENLREIFIGFILLAVGIAYVGQSLRRILVPESHPAMKALRNYGDPASISLQLAQELRIEGDRKQFGQARLTTNWLVQTTAFTTVIIRLGDLAWIYPKVVKHYASFIPTGKTFHVVVHDRFGHRFEVFVPKECVSVFLASLQRRTPWAVYGFSAQLKASWEKNRAQFLRNVDARRQSISAPQQPQQSSKPAAPAPAEVLARR
jgi:hypothetical protein